jgi:hypothetical protein
MLCLSHQGQSAMKITYLVSRMFCNGVKVLTRYSFYSHCAFLWYFYGFYIYMCGIIDS